MARKVKGYPDYILEPSAGKADLIEAYAEAKDRHGSKQKFSAIEIDPDLRATLRGKNIAVIDHDFLAFNGPDKFVGIPVKTAGRTAAKAAAVPL